MSSPTTERGKEAARERARRWYAENKERAKANAKAWKKANPDKLRRYRVTEHAKERLAAGAEFDPTIDYEALWTGWCGICDLPIVRDLPRGSSMSPTIDHIVPLSKGGNHTSDNLEWVHMGCNASKGARL